MDIRENPLFAFFHFCQNGTFEPVHEIQNFFGPKAFFLKHVPGSAKSRIYAGKSTKRGFSLMSNDENKFQPIFQILHIKSASFLLELAMALVTTIGMRFLQVCNNMKWAGWNKQSGWNCSVSSYQRCKGHFVPKIAQSICTLELLDNVKSLLPLGQILNNFDPPIKKL